MEDLIYTPELNYSSEFLKGWRSTVEVATAVGQVEAVRSGAGIGILHDFMAFDQDGLVPVIPDFFVTRQYWLVWHENMRVTKRVAAVANLLDTLVLTERSLFTRKAPDENLL